MIGFVLGFSLEITQAFSLGLLKIASEDRTIRVLNHALSMREIIFPLSLIHISWFLNYSSVSMSLPIFPPAFIYRASFILHKYATTMWDACIEFDLTKVNSLLKLNYLIWIIYLFHIKCICIVLYIVVPSKVINLLMQSFN